MDEEDQALLWLSLCRKLSCSARRALVRAQGSALKARLFLQAQGHAGPAFDQMERARLSAWMTHRSPLYPAGLRHLTDPPDVLYYRGDPARWQKVETAVTIVGTRRPSSDGRHLAGRFAHCLAQSGISIISGFARGIDTAAHRSSLHTGSPPMAILACGIDYCYPAENQELFRSIAEQGLVLSEYPPGQPPLPHHFPERNRLLAALAAAVLLVEAPARSGALLTVDHALNLGRLVFVLPGPVDHINYQGNLKRLKEGAILITSPRDLLEQLPGRTVQAGDCGESPAHADIWAQRWGMQLVPTLVKLSEHERSGTMRQDAHGRFGWALATG